MNKVFRALLTILTGLSVWVSAAGSSEATNYLAIGFWNDAENYTFNNTSNRLWAEEYIRSKMLEEHGQRWIVEHKLAEDIGKFDYMSEAAKVAGNWDPNAYVLLICVDECFINHTDFSHWRTGHVDLKDPFVGINMFLFTGYGESICSKGLSKHLSNRQEEPAILFNALYRHCFRDAWDNFFDPWLFPKRKRPQGNYTEDYL
jgi:hypothetical protein